jgi:Leucine-rich repeat (LRR) protein
LKNLEVLNLEYNEITTIDDGLFDTLINLKCLNLSSNELTIIKSNWFKCLENLKELDLHSNKIQSIDDDAFDKLIKLETLDLNNNEFIKTEKLALILLKNFNYFIKKSSKCRRDFESMCCFLIINDNNYFF